VRRRRLGLGGSCDGGWNGSCRPPSSRLRTRSAIRAAIHLTLEGPRIRGIATRVPRFVPGQPVPCLEVTDLSLGDPRGLVSMDGRDSQREWSKERILALFVHDDGRVLSPTARQIWALLLEQMPGPGRYLDYGESARVFRGSDSRRRAPGPSSLRGAVAVSPWSARTREKEQGPRLRKPGAGRSSAIGLAAVRQHRLNELAKEETAWNLESESRATSIRSHSAVDTPLEGLAMPDWREQILRSSRRASSQSRWWPIQMACERASLGQVLAERASSPWCLRIPSRFGSPTSPRFRSRAGSGESVDLVVLVGR